MKRQKLFLAVLSVLALGVSASAAERDVQDLVYLGEKGPVLVRLHVRIDGKPLLDVWEDFVGKLFAYLDADGDGVLSKTEAAHMPPMAVLFSDGPTFVGKQPNIAVAFDRNQNGKITKEELAEGLSKNGAAPFQFRSDETVANKLMIAYVGQLAPLSADALNAKLFTLLDADKNGKLSRAELAVRRRFCTSSTWMTTKRSAPRK